jgi:hypothetical protein
MSGGLFDVGAQNESPRCYDSLMSLIGRIIAIAVVTIALTAATDDWMRSSTCPGHESGAVTTRDRGRVDPATESTVSGAASVRPTHGASSLAAIGDTLALSAPASRRTPRNLSRVQPSPSGLHVQPGRAPPA